MRPAIFIQGDKFVAGDLWSLTSRDRIKKIIGGSVPL
jgi:hypothetical protein